MITKKKILHILWSGDIGGTEEYVTSLVKYFNYSKYEIHLCFLHKKGAIFKEALGINNIKVAFIDIKSRFDITSVLRFVKYLYKNKFDIIHTHVRGSYLYTGLLSLFKVPKILTHHLSPGDIRWHKDARLFYRFYAKDYHKITVISNAVKENLINDFKIKYPQKIKVVHNGIDLEKFSKFNSIPSDMSYVKNINKFIFGFVGRMQYFKRPLLFIEIAAELIKKNRAFYFIMVGDGPEIEKCKNLIHYYKISEHFKLLGFRRDISSVLKLFDAFLFTSVGEGFGIVLVEAMAMGIPVFAINDGAVSEIISHGENGILLNSVDPKIIAQQIFEALEDNKLIDNIKKQCIEDVHSKFSIEVCVKQIEKIYEEVLNNAGAQT